MGWLDGLAASVIGAALKGLYLPAVLHKQTIDHNGVPIGGETDFAVQAQVDSWTAHDLSRSNVPSNSSRIFVLRLGAQAEPNTDDELTVKGVRYKLADFPDQDPADVCWTMVGIAI